MRWLVGMVFEPTLGIAEDRGAWLATVYGVAELDMTWQSNNNPGRNLEKNKLHI